MPRHGGAAPSERYCYSRRNLACEWRGVPSRSKVEGKRLRVVDFRSISDGGGEGNTLCRYQSLAFRVDTAKAEKKKADTVENGTRPILFVFRLFNFNFCAGVGQLLSNLIGGFLGDAFLDRLRSGFNESLCIGKAKTGDFTSHLDNGELVSAEALEDDVEFRR